ncbi:MAG: tRNA (adenosine(37)-N6)-threonylcarbamoyltransferase complex dimerization subunit type 1 TsaB, partial [Pseudomonadota bacterium]|nr:tRNA (adenosine(37)-N6)-threonylcarbamoyltransferase complex dimerization subunit type 1 TsaB [Pseudomonadota bacterium]
MIVLAFDTCLGACSAALADGDAPPAEISEAMTRGHQERLAPMVRDLMVGAKIPFDALDRIAVTVGPGSFTGLRVGLAFAKGLALALDRPCVGVGTLEALAATIDVASRRAAVIDAGRGRVYLQVFEGAEAITAPGSLPVETAAAQLVELGAPANLTLLGPGAQLLTMAIPKARCVALVAPSPAAVAALAAR